MNVMLAPKMTVDEFLVWAMARPGKLELIDGVVFQMSPERLCHLRTKGAAYIALLMAVRNTSTPCHALPDGATVRVNASTAFEPDALVYSGPHQNGETIEIATPLIVVEVISPSSKKGDTGFKIAGYFSVPSVHHYLILDADAKTIIHHRRQVGHDSIETRVVRDGILHLDPPGIAIPVAEFFASD